ncbi:p53 and DNA damage-regulated protein 1-like [Xenia sp. Carnegie-2017]|uniref:p53 and DNA damage-regulated protein 1-like n=1 Tax=Xenia sp. Carnegie-2017 TaxID=2897299 RepID=UPI001F03A165|nr:p53 and DNA damage-regulated protein 1-like [Xenia sp. Carnegie-2017]
MLNNLSEIEELAEEILADKEQVKHLDHRRNTNREALNALKKHKKSDDSSKKSWLCLGGMFMKYPTTDISDMLMKDQKELDSEIQKIRDCLKAKVSKLHQLEGSWPVFQFCQIFYPHFNGIVFSGEKVPKGFDLTALDKDELAAFTASNR